MKTAPPRLPAWLVERAVRDNLAGRTIGADLDEEFAYRTERLGLAAARRWYWRTALGMSFGYRNQRHTRKGASLMDSLGQDLRFAVRTLRRSTGFTAAALLTLAVGVGASTAIFSILNAVVLRPLPFSEADRLMFLAEQNREGDRMGIAWPSFLDWRRELKSFESLAAFGVATFNLAGDQTGGAERLVGRQVTWEFLKTLGVVPALGRDLQPQDDQLGVDHRILISHEFWKRRFGADTSIIGRHIVMDNHSHAVIGVMPPGFALLGPADVFEAFTPRTGPGSGWADRGNHMNVSAIGRLKPGVSETAARQEVKALARAIAAAHPTTSAGVGAFLEPLSAQVVGEMRETLFAMFAAVGFLLLIACVNVTNLQIARGAARHHELAVRAALGGGRLRLVRQLMVESLLLSLAGGILGITIGAALLRTLVALAPEDTPRLLEVSLDGEALLFAAGAMLLAGLVFGTLPAIHASRGSGQQGLVRSSRGSNSAASTRLRKTLIIAETALALIMLTGAGLMLRTMQQLSAVDAGFDPQNLATVRLSIADVQWDAPRRSQFYEQLDQRARTLAGVTDATVVNSLPIEGSRWGSVFLLGDRPPAPRAEQPSASWNAVTPHFFSTFGVRVLQGRALTDADRGAAPNIVVVNHSFARRHWPQGSAVGQRIKQGFPESDTPWREIVGVVNDVKLDGVAADTPDQVYTPLSQDSPRSVAIVARTAIDPEGVLRSLEGLVREMNRDFPVYNVSTMETLMREATSRERVSAAILGLFAAVALLLASIGLYGVVSHGVTERTQEIGVRMALGASAPSIVRLFLSSGVVTAGAGILLGWVGAYWLTRFLKDLLFGVEPADALAFGAGASTLFVVALVACYIPAARAARVSPTIALRGE